MSLYSTDHTVYLNSKHLEIPSVTTVLHVINKPALPYWANGLGFKHIKVKDELKAKANVGTDLHDMLSKYTMGEEINGEHWDDAIELFKVFLEWSDKNRYKVVLSEQSLSGEEFGGTIDSIGHVNGVLSMVDYKTSSRIYSSMFLQLAGYSLLVKEKMPETYSRIKQYGILSISLKNGIQTKFVSKEDIEDKYVPVFKKTLSLFNAWFELNMEEWNVNIAK